AGARRIVLMGRTPMPPRREWAALPAGTLATRAQAVLRLEALGASVHLASVDVGDPSALSAWIDDYRGENWPPIREIVHCAGALENRLLREMTSESLTSLVRSKAGAARNLA